MQTESKSAHGVSPARTGKEQELRALMRSFGSVLVAYSGGVDSSYLAWVAKDELGDAGEAVTGLSPAFPGISGNRPKLCPSLQPQMADGRNARSKVRSTGRTQATGAFSAGRALRRIGRDRG